MKHCIEPNWPAPKNIKAYTTLRTGGHSLPPFEEFNLATHVGDKEGHVIANRELLKQMLSFPNEPIWLTQTHSTIVVEAKEENREKEADAAFTIHPEKICIVLTADCLPILLCNQEGTQVAAIHAGWRGLAGGIIEHTLQASKLIPERTLVWLGPAIGPQVFEVGNEVRQLFLETHPEASSAFVPSKEGKWLANLYVLATLRLKKQGVSQIYGGNYCTYSDKNYFFSYRRDGSQTGRMASVIWIANLAR